MPGRFFSQLAIAHHLRDREAIFEWTAPWVHEGNGLKRRFVICRVAPTATRHVPA